MDFLLPWVEQHLADTNPFIIVTVFIIYQLVWRKVKPHVEQLELRFTGIEKQLKEMKDAVSVGFANGELRFKNLETRVEKLENH